MPAVTAWATAQGFTAKPGQVLVLPDNRGGRAARVLAGIGETPDLWSWAAIAQALPEGEYQLADSKAGDEAALGWALAGYRFDRYRKPAAGRKGKPKLVWPAKANRSEEHTSELQSLMRTSYAVFCLKK